MTKVLILAFDGLDYDLIKRFKCKNIKQKQYGKLAVPDECKTTIVVSNGQKERVPYTPFVWSAFLTGKPPVEVGLNRENLYKWSNVWLNELRRQARYLKFAKFGNTKLVHTVTRILMKLGFEQGFCKQDYKCPTFFSQATKSRAINVPTLSEGWSIKWEAPIFNSANIYWRKFGEVKVETLKAISNGNWDLLMAYTRLLDVIGHLSLGQFTKVVKAYNACNAFVDEVKKLLSRDTVCLIVSDHGMEKLGDTKYGKHSNESFYSLNVVTNWKPKTTFDFHNQIVKWLSH